MNTVVTNAILDLLLERDCVVVPGLGAFLCHDEGAKVNVITNHFDCPTAQLSFDPHQRDANDMLASYIASIEGITIEEANDEIKGFVANCFADMKKGIDIIIQGVGVLFLDDNKEIAFEPSPSQNFNGEAFGLTNFIAHPVFGRDETNEQEDDSLEPSTPATPANTAGSKKKNQINTDIDSDEKDYTTPKWLSITMLVVKILGEALGVIALLILLGVIPLRLDKLPWKKPSAPPKVVVQPIDSTAQNNSPTVNDSVSVQDTVMNSDTVTGMGSLIEVIDKDLLQESVASPVTEEVSEPVAEADTVVESESVVKDSVVEPKPVYQYKPYATLRPLVKKKPVVVSEPTPATQDAPSASQPVRTESPSSPSPAPSATQDGPGYYIIGGCFSVRENAESLVATLHKDGFTSAFVMDQGEKMYVCYGRFNSSDEANLEIARIHAYSDNKVWVMKKK